MATRVRLDLDTETYGRLIEAAVDERRPADWQAEVILRRALGTWEESRIGRLDLGASPVPSPVIAEQEAERVPA